MKCRIALVLLLLMTCLHRVSANAPCVGEGSYTLAGSGTAFKSDGDGYTSTISHGTSASCAWDINCGTQFGAIQALQSTIGTGATLLLKNYVSSVTQFSLTGANPGGTVRGYFTGDTGARVAFTSLATAARGFQGTLKCYPAQCSDNRVDTVINSGFPKTLMTDTDGSSSTTLTFLNEMCNWQFACPSGFLVFYITAGAVSTTTNILFQDSTATTLRTITGGVGTLSQKNVGRQGPATSSSNLGPRRQRGAASPTSPIA